MIHASLFNGFAGFMLAAEMVGWDNIMSCEINDFCNTVSKDQYPNCTQHHDIRKTDFSIYRGRIDVLSGGFPCQPFSVAGKQLGTEDERHLWPEMLRAVREIAPPWVVGENVRGLVNWNGGLVFEQVQADMEAEGYEVLPFLLPAAGVNAPHRRDRIWFIAHSDAGQRRRKKSEIQAGWNASYDAGSSGLTSDSNSNGHSIIRSGKAGCKAGEAERKGNKREWLRNEPERINASRYVARTCMHGGNAKITNWQNFPTQQPVCDGNDGLPAELVRQRIREDSMGHLSEEEIDKIISEARNKWRKETIKAGGNAIVPQVAYQIFKAIEHYERLQ